MFFFFFQAEDGIRDYKVTGVRTCALPISDGTVHQISLALDIDPPANRPGGNGRNALLVSRSTNGGLTWTAPITLIEDENPRFLNDKQSITADPTDPHLVYARSEERRVGKECRSRWSPDH